MTIDPDEAVAFVESIINDIHAPSKERCQRIEREAKALAKPKGPWPLALGDVVCIGPNEDGILIFEPSDVFHKPLRDKDGLKMDRFGPTNKDLDKFIVGALQHRGVDVERVVADLRFHEEAHDLDNSLSAALQSILDNAEASE